ncbi:hypothetical protein D9619_008175 [Psilocybe cf. subviscida]|uniref:Uncharacterized protein n=1 Tax=Psilocybe cf. subviscida TaxID=2480587 RepID=A0A8H5EST7_9AGAR|nr:hypothetical protein D9619_008175 [Psilocybe cf. subviscida]
MFSRETAAALAHPTTPQQQWTPFDSFMIPQTSLSLAVAPSGNPLQLPLPPIAAGSSAIHVTPTLTFTSTLPLIPHLPTPLMQACRYSRPIMPSRSPKEGPAPFPGPLLFGDVDGGGTLVGCAGSRKCVVQSKWAVKNRCAHENEHQTADAVRHNGQISRSSSVLRQKGQEVAQAKLLPDYESRCV